MSRNSGCFDNPTCNCEVNCQCQSPDIHVEMTYEVTLLILLFQSHLIYKVFIADHLLVQLWICKQGTELLDSFSLVHAPTSWWCSISWTLVSFQGYHTHQNTQWNPSLDICLRPLNMKYTNNPWYGNCVHFRKSQFSECSSLLTNCHNEYTWSCVSTTRILGSREA